MLVGVITVKHGLQECERREFKKRYNSWRLKAFTNNNAKYLPSNWQVNFIGELKASRSIVYMGFLCGEDFWCKISARFARIRHGLHLIIIFGPIRKEDHVKPMTAHQGRSSHNLSTRVTYTVAFVSWCKRLEVHICRLHLVKRVSCYNQNITNS